MFVIPEDVSRKHSVLIAVGLLPMAVSGISVDEVMDGAKQAILNFENSSLEENAAYQYAAVGNILYGKGKTTELLINYESSLQYFS